MRANVEQPTGTVLYLMTPTGAVDDAIAELAETLGAARIPEDFDEILGVRCSSL